MTRFAHPDGPRTAPALTVLAPLCAYCMHGGVLYTMWGRPYALAVVIAAAVLATIVNVGLSIAVQRIGVTRTELLRGSFNIVLHCAIGIWTDWSFASWVFLPFLTSLASVPPAGLVVARLAGMLAVFNGVALATGADWRDAVAFSGISVFTHLISSSYLQLASNLLRERDRTLAELTQAQQAALAQEKLASIGQLAAGVAHEINNPMCFITVNVADLLEELQRAPGLSIELAEYRDTVLPETIDGIRRVNSIVGDLRRFARGEPEQRVAFDLSEEAIAAVRMARTQLGCDQQLRTEIAPGLRVRGMPRQIGQVILNLIVNGLQALDRGGEVAVRAARCADGIELAVTDTGIGMTEETIARLFQPFFTTKPAGKGIGLGLSVVHGIVTAHGGTIDVTSAPGKGSCFRIVLPAEAELVDAVPATAVPALAA